MAASSSQRLITRTLSTLAVAGGATALAALAWGSRERRMPTVRHYELTLPHERRIAPLTILQISDLHLYAGQEFLIDFLHDVADTETIDFVLSTGDNFGSLEALPMVLDAYTPFTGLPGAFVFGSNDYYSPRRKNWTAYLRKDPRTAHTPIEELHPDLPTEDLRAAFLDMGWVDLNNASAALSLPHARLALTGVDDPHIDRDSPVPLPSIWGEPEVLSLGVTHAPYRRVVDGWTIAGADLILAGHTHGGQLGLPGVTSLVTNCDLPRSHGKGLHLWSVTDVSEYVGNTIDEPLHSWLHVSAGLGTSPYVPFRVATRPEVSVIRVGSAGFADS